MKQLGIFFIVIFLGLAVADLCPNKRDSCPSGTTCCELINGSFGCCPYSRGMCCEDKIHCCPAGTYCNTEDQSCDGKSLKIPFKWMAPLYDEGIVALGIGKAVEEKELPSISTNMEAVDKVDECPDESSCLSGQTCCTTVTADFGCCIFHNGNCCSDKRHCCPENYDCDAKNTRCIPKHFSETHEFSLAFPFYSSIRLTTKPRRVKVEAVRQNGVCPDGSICTGGQSCCQTLQGTYGCCTYERATCCSDKLHCCPENFKCDVKNKRCLPKHSVSLSQEFFSTFPFFAPIKTIKKAETKPELEVPKVSSKCSYGYCEEPNSVCCSNFGFCCPSNTVCSTFYKGCALPHDSTKFIKGTPVLPHAPAVLPVDIFDVNNPVICPDQTEACPSGDTCCEAQGGSYGCCPMPQATCCDDKLHCCPHGYICADGGCERMPYVDFFSLPTFIANTPIRKSP